MALSGGDVDKIFAVMGKALHLDEIASGTSGTLLAYKTAFEASLDDNLATEAVDIYSEFDVMDSTVRSMEAYSRFWLDRLLLKYPVIWDNLNLAGYTSSRDVMQIILRELIALSESVEANASSIGSITYDLANADSFSILTDLTLDGFVAPASWMQPSIYHDGMTSQIAIPETVEFYADGVNPRYLNARGQYPENVNSSSFAPMSVGGPRQILFSESNSLVGAFSNFSSGIPTGWTRSAGLAAGFAKEEADAFGRTAALKITGDGSTASYEIQIPLATAIQSYPRKRFCVVCFVKGNASLTAGTLTITPVATGWTGPSGIVMNQAALAAQTSYGIESFFFTAPADLYDDFALSIKLDGTPSAHPIRIAALAFVPTEFFNGASIVPVRGEGDVLSGDTALVPFANDEASDWQTRLSKKLGLQLPSSGSPTILDSLIA